MASSKSSSSHHSSGEQKFRPYFSAAELTLIIRTLKEAPAPALGLIRYLEGFAIKIERGVISPALHLEESMESKLGLSTSVPPEQSIENQATLWESYPESRSKFSPVQLESIQAWRYENNRMSPEEETEYEKSIGIGM